jgi:hypothetical protein
MNMRIRKFTANIGRGVKELCLPMTYSIRKRRKYVPLSGRKDGIVVSLTSFPKRIDTLWVVIDSLFRQTVRPDRILLALTQEEFPGGKDSLPETLTRFVPLGLEIVFLPFNYRCHNKYWAALKSYPNAAVITVDDDSFYGRRTVERLVEMHCKYPQAVCCNIAARIDPDNFHAYKSWKKSVKALEPSQLNVALGFAGVLYPPGFAEESLFDAEAIASLCPQADDLWLKAWEMRKGIKVTCGGFFPYPVTIRGSQKVSLRSTNKGDENRNDRQWAALDERYNLKNLLLENGCDNNIR